VLAFEFVASAWTIDPSRNIRICAVYRTAFGEPWWFPSVRQIASQVLHCSTRTGENSQE
jgi:hypothetical protein